MELHCFDHAGREVSSSFDRCRRVASRFTDAKAVEHHDAVSAGQGGYERRIPGVEGAAEAVQEDHRVAAASASGRRHWHTVDNRESAPVVAPYYSV